MNNLSSAFYKTLELINSVNHDENYWHKGLSLGDLLFTEIMIGELNNKENHIGFFTKIKHLIKAKKDRIRHALKDEISEGEILFFVNSSSQWNCIYPVYHSLQKANINVTVITTKPKLIKYFLELKITASLIRGFSYTNSELFDYSTSKDKLSSTIKYYLPQIKFLEQSFTNIFIKRKPKYVLVGNDITFEGRLLATISKRFNVPTGMIQHGAIDNVNLVLGRSMVDQIFVYGVNARSSLSFLGIAPHKIFISGLPKQQNNSTSANFSNKPLGFTDFVVAAFSGYGHSVSKQHHLLIIETLKMAQKALKFNLCIKIHPKDDKNNYLGFDGKSTVLLDNADLQTMKISFHDLLRQASIVLSGSSTSVLDALLVGTPVITLDLLNEYSNVGFIKDGLTAHTTSFEDFKKEIINLLLARKNNDALFSTIQQHALEDYYYRFYDNTYLPEEFITHEIQLKSGLQSAIIE
ncbi:MAG: hypothetical protein V4663_08095 [Bacteroidota bacterium]